jgi:hypothetical protein
MSHRLRHRTINECHGRAQSESSEDWRVVVMRASVPIVTGLSSGFVSLMPVV